MYKDRYSEEIVKKISKIKKKDSRHYSIVRKKMDQILESPDHRYKDLHHSMKGIKRVHIGHFVLVFVVDHKEEVVSFEDYDYHDRIYR